MCHAWTPRVARSVRFAFLVEMVGLPNRTKRNEITPHRGSYVGLHTYRGKRMGFVIRDPFLYGVESFSFFFFFAKRSWDLYIFVKVY